MTPEQVGAFVSHTLGAQVAALEKVGGGYANVVLRAHLKSWGAPSVIVRLWTRDPASCAVELAVLERARGVVPVPRVLAADVEGAHCGFPAAVLEDVPGLRADLAPKEAEVEIGELLGRAFGNLRTLTLPRGGFFRDASLDIDLMPEMPAPAQLLAFAEPLVWSEAAGRALGDDVRRAWWSLIEESAPLLDGWDDPPALVHADANFKNVLVREVSGRWELAAVLDWEFAFSGRSLVDLGNLLRFEPREGSALSDAVVRGWRDGGGETGPNFLEIARVLDVFSLCGFVVAPQNGLHGEVVALVRRCVSEGRL